jgi:UDP-2,3-diacylglucosamine pyrophosphatase LpxH
MPSNERNIAIISDLHLASGYNEQAGRFDRNEDFFYDAAFSRFIEHLTQRAYDSHQSWRLLILGDMVDFLQVEAEHGNKVTSATSTVHKLSHIIDGHRAFFGALARFIGAGHTIDIVLGNHDVEFVWPDVQAHFKQRLKQFVAEEDAHKIDTGVTFHPWIFYVPGVLYAEHGHHHDRLNCFAEQLEPFLQDHPNLIELPLGSFFVLYLFNRIEKIDPFADNVRPATRYLLWGLMHHPLRTLQTLGAHVYFFMRVLGKTQNRSKQQLEQRRRAYRSKHIERYAQQIGLPAETVAAIDALAPTPALTNWSTLFNELFVQPVWRLLLPPLPFFTGSAITYALVKRLQPRLRWPLSLMTGTLASALQKRWLVRPATRTGNYLLDAAHSIDELLRQANMPVPVYVFGHTHTAELFTLDQSSMPRYVNSGTWTPIIPSAFDLLSARERFTFVEVTRGEGGRVQAELNIWNDAAGRVESMPLLSY